MNDMAATIIPKSDQLNADDLIAGTMTIVVTDVKIKSSGGEQPISIHYEGDNGKPYKACKSMCRVLVTAWGADSKKYVGRSMTLYRDPSVTWAGMAVGGIRISHLSDIDSKLTMALTATKQTRKPYTVSPLVATKAARPEQTAAPKVSVDSKLAGDQTHNATEPSDAAATTLITVDQSIVLEDDLKKANIPTAKVKAFFKVKALTDLTVEQLGQANTMIDETLAKRAQQ